MNTPNASPLSRETSVPPHERRRALLPTPPPHRFGEAISLCFWTDTFRPDSWYAKMARNKQAGLPPPPRGTPKDFVGSPPEAGVGPLLIFLFGANRGNFFNFF